MSVDDTRDENEQDDAVGADRFADVDVEDAPALGIDPAGRSADPVADAIEQATGQTTNDEEDDGMAETRGISKATSARKSAAKVAAGARKSGGKKAARTGVARAPKTMAERAPRARAARSTKEPAVRSVTSGLREHPKNKKFALNTDAARSVVGKALTLFLKSGDPTDVERDAAQRLLARIDARS